MPQDNNRAAATEASFLGRRAGAVLSFLIWSCVFGLACTQAPLYFSNQNQYLVHGAADAGVGYLDRDWLANTADPTPLFSALIAATYRFLHPALFYVYYLFVFGAYFHAMTGLFTALAGDRASGTARLCFVTLLVALHAGIVRLASVRLFGVDYPWYLQCGVANQYILGAVFQPSVFGVFLVVSLVSFLRDRPLAAVTWSSLAAVVHATYLLGAAFFTLGYLFVLWREGRTRAALLTGTWALVLVLPTVVYHIVTFAPSSPEAFAEAQRLLVEVRIPHHAEPRVWFDAIALAQVVGIVAALALLRGTRVFPVLAVVFLLSLLLSLLQAWTGNDTLALLFPWRTSAVLVPVATTVLAGSLVLWLASRRAGPGGDEPRRSPWAGSVTRVACAAVLGLMVAGGVAINYFELGYHSSEEELPLLEYVHDHKSPDDVYLLPVDLPKLATGPKSPVSTSFMPPPRRGKDRHLIAVDLQRFRLLTGAPIFVDFKSVPYKDVEVLEWHDRLHSGAWLYRQTDWDQEEVRSRLACHGITHVITTAERGLHSQALELVYDDGVYRVFRVHWAE